MSKQAPVPPVYDALHVIDHPVVRTALSQLRDARTDTPRFRELIQQIGQLLAYEATRDIETIPDPVQTPLEPADGARLPHGLLVVPILRAGLAMAEGVLKLMPDTPVGHIGMFRDEQKLEPVHYYQNLPTHIGPGTTLLVDPMLATGGSVLAAVELLHQRGYSDVRFLCVIAAPEGLERVYSVHPDLPIYTAAIDRELDDRGYICPGLGDAGDRAFGTTAT